MAGGSPAAEVHFIKLVHALDLRARAIVLLHPGDDLDAALLGFRADLLHRVGKVEVALFQPVRLHLDIAIILGMGGDKVAGGVRGAVQTGP